MAKTNIWMPFYIGDYMAATTGLSTEQHGAYMLLLFAYWDKEGPLPDDDAAFAQITRLNRSRWSKHRPVIERYFKVREGLWHHKRVDDELAKVKVKSEKAKRAADAMHAEKKKREAIHNALADEMRTHSECNATASKSQPPSMPPSTCSSDASHSHSQNHLEVLRERAGYSQEAHRPSLTEVQDEAQRLGLAPWKAEDWFHEMEGGGWLDHSHRPVSRWQSVLARVRTKWEADGRPMQPPSANATRSHGQSPVWAQIKSLEKTIELKKKALPTVAAPHQYEKPETYQRAVERNRVALAELKELKVQVAKLHERQAKGEV